MQLEEGTWYYIPGSDLWSLDDKQDLMSALVMYNISVPYVAQEGIVLLRSGLNGVQVGYDIDGAKDGDVPLDLEV